MALGIGDTATIWIWKSVWMLIILFGAIAWVFGFLYIRKWFKLDTNVAITTMRGDRLAYTITKGGFFYNKVGLFGFWDYGNEQVFKLKDRREVLYLESGDFTEINGKRGLIVVQKPGDPQILVPVRKSAVINSEIFLTVAPVELRDAATRLYFRDKKETEGSWEKYGQYIGLGATLVVFIIGMIIMLQYGKYVISTTSDQLQSVINMINNMGFSAEAVRLPSSAP